MEDVFKFLLVAAVIVIGLVNQSKKEAKKNAGKSPRVPVPDPDKLPEYHEGDTYGGYIPEGPKPTAEPASAFKPFVPSYKEQNNKRHSFQSKSHTSSYTPNNASPPAPAPQESDETSEFGIHSAEEARKAIIWSEILQRKY